MCNVRVWIPVLGSALLCVAQPTLAGPAAVGGLAVGQGWGQCFQENGWYNNQHFHFDALAVRVVSGGVFAPLALRDFSGLRLDPGVGPPSWQEPVQGGAPPRRRAWIISATCG